MFKLKLYETYNKVKHIYKKPILKWSFCKWKHSNLLPVWRHGNEIALGKHGEYSLSWSYAKLINSEWNSWGKRQHPILSMFFKPYYQLPLWLSFYVFNHDVFVKWKYDTVQFEYPPQFSIVIFGWSLNFWLTNPTGDINHDYSYWESIFNYLDTNDEDYLIDVFKK